MHSFRLHERLVVGAGILLSLAAAPTVAARDAAVKDLVETCKAIAERNSGDEAWFWFQAQRVQLTQSLWSERGVRALRTHLHRTADPLERDRLERALRESHRGQIEYY